MLRVCLGTAGLWGPRATASSIYAAFVGEHRGTVGDRWGVEVILFDAALKTGFAWAARNDFLSRVPHHDLFAFFEVSAFSGRGIAVLLSGVFLFSLCHLLPVAQDDHDLRAHHLAHFLRWTSCAHLPQQLLTPARNLWGAEAVPSCFDRVPDDWIVGLMQVTGTRRRGLGEGMLPDPVVDRRDRGMYSRNGLACWLTAWLPLLCARSTRRCLLTRLALV